MACQERALRASQSATERLCAVPAGSRAAESPVRSASDGPAGRSALADPPDAGEPAGRAALAGPADAAEPSGWPGPSGPATPPGDALGPAGPRARVRRPVEPPAPRTGSAEPCVGPPAPGSFSGRGGGGTTEDPSPSPRCRRPTTRMPARVTASQLSPSITRRSGADASTIVSSVSTQCRGARSSMKPRTRRSAPRCSGVIAASISSRTTGIGGHPGGASQVRSRASLAANRQAASTRGTLAY